MKESYLFDMPLNNVIFAGRNKAYGAYELRKVYSKHVTAAAFMAITIFVAGIGWPMVIKNQTSINDPKVTDPGNGPTVIEIVPILPPPPAKEEVLPEQPKPQPVQQTQKTVPYTKPKVVKDNAQVTGPEMPDQQELNQAIIGTTYQEGETGTGQNALATEPGAPGGTGVAAATEENTIHDFVSEMPYFEGGEAGLLKYIGKKIRYPREAVSEQIEGVVVVSFVINRQGNVTDATILKGLGYGTDEEALRVINSMPNWTPGKQNGKPVAVRYTLPIRFSMKR